MDNFNLAIILGTSREGAKSEKVFNFVSDEAKNFGFEIEPIKVKDWLDKPLTGGMDKEKKYKVSLVLKKASGFIIVSPEYNHSFSGELKIFLDEFYEEFSYKPVSICGVSSGMLGGSRMIEQLKLVCLSLGMIVLKNHCYFYKVDDFEVDKEKYKQFLNKVFEEFNFIFKKFNQDSFVV